MAILRGFQAAIGSASRRAKGERRARRRGMSANHSPSRTKFNPVAVQESIESDTDGRLTARVRAGRRLRHQYQKLGRANIGDAVVY
jgi:hypothetical protein